MGDRRTVYTHSTAGLLFGLFGGVVSAFFTYFVTITASGAFVLDPGAALTALTRIGDVAPVRWPVVALDPFLPVLELMVAILCSLSAARHVGVSLISRPRLLWIVLFGLALALGVLTTGTVAQQAHWTGLAITLLALSLPHHTDPR
ncbi:hypothetical protein [Kutzneria sp. CA-103260]|uniref:hypothetical protein n=1 Tax=Kutzneria sp. CA-103260 TaxID=2802641 RepID=UPI001BA822A0|nr:hypothetical protein [Kutzneria sp. CA-103260]QUQ69424.1 hypothetical protein JJ691_71820 [Kutzneria sp. CA-103260]